MVALDNLYAILQNVTQIIYEPSVVSRLSDKGITPLVVTLALDRPGPN